MARMPFSLWKQSEISMSRARFFKPLGLQGFFCCWGSSVVKEHLKRTQFRVETGCANKVWLNLIALVM
jgi:hypothetical protein